MRDLHQAVDGELFGDLEALFSQAEVEAFGAVEVAAVDLDQA